MKKIFWLFSFLTLIFFFSMSYTGCKNNNPAVAPTMILNPPQQTATAKALITQTAIALLTAGPAAQLTATAVSALQTAGPAAQLTATAIAQQTATAQVQQQATQTAVAAAQTAVATDSSALVSVPAGTFFQTGFYHTISAYKMGKYQVVYLLWFTVYQWAIANGYTFQNAGAEGSGGTSGAAPTSAKYQPVTAVSWRDAIVWCNAYSEKSGLTPCYNYLSADIKDSTNVTACDNAVCVWTNNGYRLPSEGEYQYAASYIDGSNWTPDTYASGATADYTNEAATDLVTWNNSNSGGATHSVGLKTANSLGIYDVSGNVWEWCWDWYGTYPGTSTDYRGSASGTYRVLRGGDFYTGLNYLQVSYRNFGCLFLGTISYFYPNSANSNYGFRFARTY